MPEPDVFAYAQYRKYLADWFDAKKAANARLSHRWFARELGTNDPSALLNIIAGRRGIADDRLDGFIRVLELEGSRAAYFRALVAFEDAADDDSASRAWAALAELRTRENPEIGLEAFEFMSTWYHCAVRELAWSPAFVADPAWIATHLDPPITEEQAARSLELCLRLGYLVRDGDRIVCSEPTLRTPPELAQLASWPYHRDTLHLAADGLQRLRGTDADFKRATLFLGGTFAVPASRLREMRRMVYEMLSRLGAQTDVWHDEADRVVQLSISMVPVGRMTD